MRVKSYVATIRVRFTGRPFAPRGASRDPLDGIGPAVAWVRGRGGLLEGQRERLRMAMRLLLALHAPSPRLPAAMAAPYASLAPSRRRARLLAIGEARERIERNVDPAGILEGLKAGLRAADLL